MSQQQQKREYKLASLWHSIERTQSLPENFKWGNLLNQGVRTGFPGIGISGRWLILAPIAFAASVGESGGPCNPVAGKLGPAFRPRKFFL